MAEHVPIVVLSNVPEDEQGMAVLAAGATGYSSALTLPEVLRQVANVVEHGGLWVGPQLMRRLMQGLAVRNTAPQSPHWVFLASVNAKSPKPLHVVRPTRK